MAEHLLLLITGLALMVAAFMMQFHGHDNATIGGTEVPAIQCEEDEVISWTDIDTLGCVHYEKINDGHGLLLADLP